MFVSNIDEFDPSTGFSWSRNVDIEANDDAPLVSVYFPYPAYNDEQLLSELLAQPIKLQVGKWLKKSADPVSTVLMVIQIMLTPEAQELFRTRVYPLFEQILPYVQSLWDRALGTKVILQFQHESGAQTNVMFMPAPESVASMAENVLQRGLTAASRFAVGELNQKQRHPKLIVMQFDTVTQSYFLLSCEYADGELVHIATQDT
ncbi:MAG: hypothetical protein ACI9SE_002898 [Neolewinella sp.]